MDETIDCAIPLAVPGNAALLPHLSEWWQTYIAESGYAGPEAAPYPAHQLPGEAPRDAVLERVRGYLTAQGIARGIVYAPYDLEALHNEDLAAALATAVNEWQRVAWLEQEPRLRGSILVRGRSQALAVAEIDRLAADSRFVQVLLPVRAEAPYGNRRYWPIFEAAARHRLPVAIYAGGTPGLPTTPAGWTSYAIEDYVAYSQTFAAQVLSLVSEGVFARYPDLRVTLISSGCSWLPSLLWRLDKNWRGLRREVPWLVRPPSEYVRDALRLTLAPFDGPAEAEALLEFSEWCGSEALLLYAGYDPAIPSSEQTPLALPDGLREAVRRAILTENARAIYAL